MKGASSRGRGFVTRVDDIIVFEDSIAGFDATFEDSGAAQTSASLRNRPLRGRQEEERGLGVFEGSLDESTFKPLFPATCQQHPRRRSTLFV